MEVFGLDLSSNMVGIAWDRSPNFKDLKVRFEIGDVTKHHFTEEYFDVIYSRDTILHIQDKKALFDSFQVRKHYNRGLRQIKFLFCFQEMVKTRR